MKPESVKPIKGSDPDEPTLEIPRPGVRLAERYDLGDEIGRGGMGVVYRATDPTLDREVAVKMIPPGVLGSGAVERFRREARTLAQLDHPGVLPIYDFGEHQGSLFLIMPLVAGSSLRVSVRDRALVLGEILDVAIQLAEALDYSHRLEVIHRDVKPENVMLSREARGLRARLMDFGLARQATATATRLTRSGSLLGTLAYMSPEQVGDRTVDHRADLYALGMVLYECLSGEPAFVGTMEALLYRIAHEQPRSLRRQGVEVSEELDALVLAALSKDPSSRPATGADFAEALQQVAAALEKDERTRSVIAAPRSGRPEQQRQPMVGRKAEFAELQERLHQALDGECRLVIVEGDAGSGKTRLLDELDHLAAVRGIRVLHGRFADRQTAMPFQGFCDLIEDYFRDQEEASSPSSPDLSDLADDLQALFPVFSEIEALRSSSSSRENNSETPAPALQATEPTYVFELLARTLTRLAGGRPLVVLLENLHAGEQSIEALEYIVHRLGPTPTLFVGTCRPNDVSRQHALWRLLEHFDDNPRFKRLPIGPLSTDELRQLLRHELDTRELDDDMVDRIERATEGNPFFTWELVRSLVESDDLRRDASGVWRLRKKSGLTRDALPETVQQTVKKRLQRLDEKRRRILGIASVLGRRFDGEDLEALADEMDDLDDVIDSLVEEGILAEDRHARGDWLAFTSAVVADVLYHEVPRRRRRKLHRKHAERLEKRHRGRLERVYPQLLHHFSEGDVADKAIIYGLEMARFALASFSPEEALHSAQAALELIDEDEADEAALRGELHFLAARAYRLGGRLGEALFEAEQAVNILARNEQGEAGEAALFLAEISWQRRRGDDAQRWVDRGLELAGDSAPLDVRRGLLNLGTTLANLRGDYSKARRYVQEETALLKKTAVRDDDEAVPEGGTLVTVLPVPLTNFDPARILAEEEAEVCSMIYETLLTTDESGVLRPLLCETWQGSEDGRAFEVRLYPNVVFSDGSRLDSESVKSSLERALRKGQPLFVGTFSCLQGYTAFAAGEGSSLTGIECLDKHRIAFHLTAPLPIFPSLLTHPNTAVIKESAAADGALLGTGPFILGDCNEREAILYRNTRYWRAPPPRLEKVRFRWDLDAAGVLAGLREGEIDLGRDLPPDDLEDLLRDPQFRAGLVESTKKNVFFVLFNVSGPVTKNINVRRALAGVLRPQELVWRSLGRFAQPAVSLLPPGILGHDPARRLPVLSRGEARALLREANVDQGVEIQAAIHPSFQDRYASLMNALADEWATLGFKITNRTPTAEQYFLGKERDVDVLLGRWVADHNDPDSFTFTLFQRENGHFKQYHSSREGDELITRARQESNPSIRQELYQKFEDLLEEQSVLAPLFHDVNYRIANPRVRGLQLSKNCPYVNYISLGKLDNTVEDTLQTQVGLRASLGGEIHVPIQDAIQTLDPHFGPYTDHLEVMSTVFETLVLEDDTRIIPWLAESFESRNGGREYYFRLREGVYFHDGRRFTARDVRYSFERNLRSPNDDVNFPVLPIRGAEAAKRGERKDISGIRILSNYELSIELEEPTSFFPTLLTCAYAAIIPEGSHNFAGTWRDGCSGTGPFRVARFERGKRVELEKHVDYWRPEYPRSEKLIFHVGMSHEQAIRDFRRGQLTLLSQVSYADFEKLRREPELMAGYKEMPGLTNYFVVLNSKRGPFGDADLRRCFRRSFDFKAIVQEVAGQLVIPSDGFIPPGLAGYETSQQREKANVKVSKKLKGLELRLLAHPAFSAQHEATLNRLRQALIDTGIQLKALPTTIQISKFIAEEQVDLAVVRWLAEYPDADGFVGTTLYSTGGFFRAMCGSPDLDRLIEAGRRETDPVKRHGIYRQIEEYIDEQALIIPLFNEQVYRFCQPGVEGLRLTLISPQVRYDELVIGDAR